MAAPILLLPCRYVAPLALPAPKDYVRPAATAGAASERAATNDGAGAIRRATSVRVEAEGRRGPGPPPRPSKPTPPSAAPSGPPSRAPSASPSAPPSDATRAPDPRSAPSDTSASPTSASASSGAGGSSGAMSSRAPWDHEPPDPAPRAPTVRPKPPPRPRDPMAPKAAPEAAHDLVVVPQAPTFRASANGVMALVRFLQTSQLLAVRTQQDLPDGSLVLSFAPDVFAHQLFFEGASLAGAPTVVEAWLRTSPTPTPLRFGPPARQSCFAFELLGCRFPAISEGMKARMHQILYLRPELVRVDHDPTRLEHQSPAPALQPIPRCDILEIDDG